MFLLVIDWFCISRCLFFIRNNAFYVRKQVVCLSLVGDWFCVSSLLIWCLVGDFFVLLGDLFYVSWQLI